jgi:hypothetical protein
MAYNDFAKFDEPLTRLAVWCEPHATEVFVPIIVRCALSDHDGVDDLILAAGGFTRHRLTIVPALTAFVPLDGVYSLAADARVHAIELSQRMTLATSTRET